MQKDSTPVALKKLRHQIQIANDLSLAVRRSTTHLEMFSQVEFDVRFQSGQDEASSPSFLLVLYVAKLTFAFAMRNGSALRSAANT